MINKDLLDLGLDCHRKGNLVDAEAIYLSLMQSAPDSAEPPHLLAVIRAQQGRNAEALGLIDTALRLKPSTAYSLCAVVKMTRRSDPAERTGGSFSGGQTLDLSGGRVTF